MEFAALGLRVASFSHFIFSLDDSSLTFRLFQLPSHIQADQNLGRDQCPDTSTRPTTTASPFSPGPDL